MSSFQFLQQPYTAAIVGCPFSGGQSKPGVDEGPEQIIKAGLITQLEQLGWKVMFDRHQVFEKINAKDDPPMGIMKNPRQVSRAAQDVAQVVAEHLSKKRVPITLGGDHSLAVGTISGTLRARPDACVIWVDAHADINSLETTQSGNIHGMPLSILLGIGSKIDEFSWVKPVLSPDRLVYIGLRDLDHGEKRILREYKIRAFSMHEVDKLGIGRVMEMALDHVNPLRNRPIHLSFDIDAFDPSVAPSTGTPVRGGLSFREGHYICEEVCATGLLVALDVVEVNPCLAEKENAMKTVSVGCSVVRTTLGETLL